ncbi:MAG: indolepyruvate oxidoreductase subunit beta [Candidatus Diapherotrites archaeon]|nr:indolepyruvate oxidoreductase subunit beta [Candidatus Diapherotrites archaeon]
MEKNIIICGVGGQGILTIARIIVSAAQKEGLSFKQAEIHGMSQRGGAVYVHLRISKGKIYSPIIPEGYADLILSMEPLEALRYLKYLKKNGKIISSIWKLPNISYDEKVVVSELKRLKAILVDLKGIAQKTGNPLAENMALLGSASSYLGLKEENLKDCIRETFISKATLMESNLKAFELGNKST